MRKSYVLVFFLLLLTAGLVRLGLTHLLMRPQMPPLQRIQDFMDRHSNHRAVVLVGDSLVEWAEFSPTICGLPVINAGKAGARAADVLQLVGDMRRIRFAPAILVISVGINDTTVVDPQPFAESYSQIVDRAVALAEKVFVVSLAPVGNSGSAADIVDRSRLPKVAETIRQTARQRSIPLIDVSALSTAASPVTADGVHLSRVGYLAWTGAIESALAHHCP